MTLGSAGISTFKKASSGSAGLVAVVPRSVVEAHVVKHRASGQAGLRAARSLVVQPDTAEANQAVCWTRGGISGA